jgi:pantoate--beta-alanine ligase
VITARTVDALRGALADRAPAALVPTMGALHDGHRALLRAARREQGPLVMSLFVNPAQFGPNEDLAGYPRDERGDAAIAEDEGVDVLFAPALEQVYPPGFATSVDPGPVAGVLCGRRRPGHFRGVATVVARLLGLVRPRTAWFGEKDWQQLVVVRRVVRDLALEAEVRGVATVREQSGLALSSRNAYLDAAERTRAASLFAALHEAELRYGEGERDGDALLAAARRRLAVEPEYLELHERDELGSYDPARPAVLAIAAQVGRARLIDNVQLTGEPLT